MVFIYYGQTITRLHFNKFSFGVIERPAPSHLDAVDRHIEGNGGSVAMAC